MITEITPAITKMWLLIFAPFPSSAENATYKYQSNFEINQVLDKVSCSPFNPLLS